MSIIPPGLSRNLQFYLSGPLPCPYLPEQVERKLFTRLSGDGARDAQTNSGLTRAGFRRSHDIVYRPACPQCSACVPVRIPVRQFAPSQSLRRTQRRNADLTLEITGTDVTQEQFALFTAYQQSRHADSDMARMSFADFNAMVREGQTGTKIFQLRTPGGALAGAVLADTIGDGYSAIYSFFDPAEAKRSLGVMLIMMLVHEAEYANLPYVYLGYWIARSRKMAYKARFRPLQALGPHGWDWLPETHEQ
ncbi:MAG: arginyltransferase [Alphaproteobacteria bacterium]|nr:arginyltransferase [Alphaproteobacteria bacterium]